MKKSLQWMWISRSTMSKWSSLPDTDCMPTVVTDSQFDPGWGTYAGQVSAWVSVLSEGGMAFFNGGLAWVSNWGRRGERERRWVYVDLFNL